MQSLGAVTATDLLAKCQTLLYKFEIYVGAAWVDLCALGGANYLKSVSITPSGAGPTPEVVAGSWSAEIYNSDGQFHPLHPSSSYTTYFQIGRKVRVSVGGLLGGSPVYWQRLIGYMDAPKFDQGDRTVQLSGCDYSKRLADFELRSPDNYWGDVETFDSVASYTESGAQLYALGDALDPVSETNGIDGAWTTNDIHSLFVSVSGGGGVYYGKYSEDDGGSGWVKNVALSSLTKDTRYVFKIKYRTPSGGSFLFELAQTISSVRQVIWSENAAESGAWVEKQVNFTAPGTENLEFKITGSGLGVMYMEIDWVSLKAGLLNWNRYAMPADCNGPYYVELDNAPVWQGDKVMDDGTGGGWYYDESTNYFYFDEEKSVTAGTANLKVYYYTDQTPEDIVADIMADAGLYADKAAALADMSYTATGVTLQRVWFDPGTSALQAIAMVCERVNYRFWFDYSGKPYFKPATAVATADWAFTSYGDLSGLRTEQDLSQLCNRVVIEGIEQGMYETGEDKKTTRLSGSASDATSITLYMEHTESIRNHLFQTQASIDAMCAAVLAERKDPNLYADVTIPACAVPLDMGDTITWTMMLANGALYGYGLYDSGRYGEAVMVTGIIRAMTIDNGTLSLRCEIST